MFPKLTQRSMKGRFEIPLDSGPDYEIWVEQDLEVGGEGSVVSGGSSGACWSKGTGWC
jgi:hypothetical protein